MPGDKPGLSKENSSLGMHRERLKISVKAQCDQLPAEPGHTRLDLWTDQYGWLRRVPARDALSRYFSYAPPTGRVWHKAFLGGSGHRAVAQTRPAAPKCLGPRRHSTKRSASDARRLTQLHQGGLGPGKIVSWSSRMPLKAHRLPTEDTGQGAPTANRGCRSRHTDCQPRMPLKAHRLPTEDAGQGAPTANRSRTHPTKSVHRPTRVT